MDTSNFHREELDKIIANYRTQSKDTVRLLEKIVELFGFLPEEVLHKLAEELMLPFEELFTLAKTNGLFNFAQKGKHIISVCCGTSCFVKGSNEILSRLSAELGLAPGETTPDGNFSLEIVRCLGACGLGPNVMIDGEVFANMKPEKVPQILARYTGENNKYKD